MSTKAVQKPDQIMKGIVFACIAFFMFTVSHGTNKLLFGIHHPIEVAFARNIICLLPCLIYVLATKKYELFKTSMPVTLGLRVAIGTTGFVFTLAAAQYLPISNATVLFFTSTLLIPVLAHFILKEHIGIYRWIAVGIGMCGVILVAQPSAEFTMIGVALALGAAAVQATIQVLIRAMKSENPFTITFYFFAGGALMTGLGLPFVWTTPDLHSLGLLLIIGVTGGLGQYFLTRGFQMAPASLLGPFNYTGLIWATGMDIIIWHHFPDTPVYLGGAIIIASKLFIIYREYQLSKKRPE